MSWYPPAMADQMGKPWDDLMPAIMDIADRFELKVGNIPSWDRV